MKKLIAITPGKCTGCATCSLKCAITHGDSYDLNRTYIQIVKGDFEGLFHIVFSSGCRNCLQCAAVCPSQCLSIVHVADANEESIL